MSLGDPAGLKVLEVGAGRGADSVYLAQHGAEAYVLDFSQEALKTSERLARQSGVDLNLVEADATDIPFPAGTFDLIFHQGFIEHFRDPVPLLCEQNRVLKPGGLILVDVPQKYCLYTLRKQLAIKRGTWFAGWETQFGPRQLEKLMRRAGFTIVASYAWGMTGSWGWGIRNGLYRLKAVVKRLSGGGPAVQHDESQIVDEMGQAGSSKGQSGPVPSPRLLMYLADNIGVVGRK